MGSKKNILFTIASLLFAISSARIFEGVIKRELRREWQDLREEYPILIKQKEELEEKIKKKEGDKMLLSLQKELAAKKEPYLKINRRIRIAQLKLEDKTLREMKFSIKGRRVIADEILLPSGLLKVQEKVESLSFYLPDWIYELLGKEIPQDTLSRQIKDAFGKYCLFLGGDICLSGKVKEEVPDGALDLIYLEFTGEDIETIYHTLKEGSYIFFF
ncbi:MAG: hypothetical protein ABIK81_02525 [candidate division WOR-3 bacterium]